MREGRLGQRHRPARGRRLAMIEAAVQAALRAIPEVAAIVDDRIYPTTLPADAILPAASKARRSISVACVPSICEEMTASLRTNE